jgi:hypothetical protein
MHLCQSGLPELHFQVGKQELADERMRPPDTALLGASRDEAEMLRITEQPSSARRSDSARNRRRFGLEVVQDRRADKEGPHLGLQIPYDFLGQVVVKVAFGTGQ